MAPIYTTSGKEVKYAKVDKYLRELRDSGKINMWEARPYIANRFKVSGKDAATLLSQWIKSFKED